MWTLIGHRSELASPGDYVLLGETVAYNDNGNVIAAHNFCPHRGTRVFDQPCGNKPWVCPYHGWAYRDGKMHATKPEAFTEAQMRKANIVQYLTQWVGDFLFYAKVPNVKLADQLGGLAELIEAVSRAIVKRHSHDTINMDCNWRVAVENALEDYHVPMIHRETFNKLDIKPLGMDQHGKNSLGKYMLNDERTLKLLASVASNFEQCEPGGYFHAFIYPYTCLSSVGGFTYSVQHYLPTKSGTTLLTRLYTPKVRQDARGLAFFFDEAAKFNRQVFEEDATICARVPEPMGVLGLEEQRVMWFRDEQE